MTKPAPRFAPFLSLLLLGAAVPAAAQSAQDPPAEDSTPLQEEEVQSPTPVQPGERSDPPARETPAERPVRSTPPPTDFPPAAPPAPPAVIIEQVPVPVPMPGPLPVDPLLNTVEELPVGDPYNNSLEVYPEIVTTEDEGGGLAWPLIVAAILLVLGAIAFLLARGPRRRGTTVVERAIEEPAFVPPVAAAPIAPAGRPRIDVRMRPLRAGVEGDGARIEFELTVLNEGPIEAEDVRVFTWMTATAGNDATRALMPPPGHVGTPPVALAAGEARTLQASVALPRAGLPGSSLLPAVVVDVRYRLPGGRDGRTAAAFSVGLPAGDELGPFPLDGAAGLHQGVIALPLGEAAKT